jgi:TAT (twin-arginine translocation) pathway signal sequence
LNRISRREFVATAAVTGAAAVLPAGTFALQEESPKTVSTSAARQIKREVVSLQAFLFPMSTMRLGPGVFNAAAEAIAGI